MARSEEGLVAISRDSFARTTTVRRVVPSGNLGCAECGSKRGTTNSLFQYGTLSDASNMRVSWDTQAFCSIGCRRSYRS